MKFLGLATIAVMLLCGHAFAGVVITLENKEFGANLLRTEMSQVSIDGRKMRVDQVERGSSFIFRGDQERLMDIDHSRKTYRFIDKQTMQGAGDQMSQMMKQMEEQLANMPPEQRQMVERMMKGKMGQQAPQMQAPQETEVKRTGSRETIHGYPCVKYEVWRGGQKVREIWATDWRKAGVKKGTLDVFKDMARFQREMFASMKGAGSQRGGFSEFEKIDGFPILTRDYENSKVRSETLFKSAKEKKMDAAIFDPPKGYTEAQALPGRGKRYQR